MGKAMDDHHKCRELFEKLSEYIDNELDSANCDAIEAHLQNCPPCQSCLATLKQTVALCREMKASAMPEAASNRLRAMIEQMLAQ
jgi:RNA polymerase sigma-70 factor (ECF subfamily)